MTDNRLTIQKTFDEFEELCADYSMPNSIVDIGNMYYYAGKFEELLKATMQREAKLRVALQEIATGRNSQGEKIDFFQDVAIEALESCENPVVENNSK